MSVINSVLKDLEARETRFTPVRIESLEPPTVRAGRRGPLLAAFGIALALLAVAAAWLLWRAPMPGGGEVPAPAVEPAAPAAIARAAPPAAPRNRIVGLQLRETAAGLRLEFALRERPVAYLRRSDGNRYAYRLSAVDSEIEAPRIDARWLEAFALDARDGGVDIDFVTAPGILVETRQAHVDGEPVWAIQLRRAPVAEPAAAPRPASPPVVVANDASPSPPATSADAAQFDPPVAGPKTSGEAVVAVAESAPEPPPALVPAVSAVDEVRLDIRSTDPAAPARNQLQYATELINSGRFGDAETLLESLLDGSEDRSAREHLLALYQLRGRGRDFARLARASAERYPAAGIFATEYARVLMQSAAYAEVVALLSPATDLDAGRQALLAAAYQRLDRHADAIRHFELALAEDAADVRHWIGLGISQEHVAALEDALHSYRTAARLGPPSERLRGFVAKRKDTLEKVLR